MRRFRSNRVKRSVACFAILGLLFQAGLAVWHATAMFALAAGESGVGVQSAVWCHGGAIFSSGAEGVSGGDGGAPLFVKNCPCCLGLVAAAIAPASAGDVALATVSSDRFSLLPAGKPASGRHRLAPESRGPPQPA